PGRDPLLNLAEPTTELRACPRQRQRRVNAGQPREVDHGEKQVAYLFLQAHRIGAFDLISDFTHFLAYLLPCSGCVRPVKTDRRHLRLDPVCVRERVSPRDNVAEKTAVSRLAIPAFRRLQRLPARWLAVAVQMRVPTPHLLLQTVDDPRAV